MSTHNNSKLTVCDNVKFLLAKSNRARNSDKYLTILYWRFIDHLNLNTFAAEYLDKGTPATSIIRARRLIQAEGLYSPTEIVARRRRDKAQAFRDSITQYNQLPSTEDMYDIDMHDKY